MRMPILHRFLSVSSLTALLVSLSNGNALATQVWATGFENENTAVELSFILERRVQLVLYGLGPSGNTSGGRTPLSDPAIALFRVSEDGSLQPVDDNDNWQDHSSADQTREALDDFGASLNEKEAAMVKTLDSGEYLLRLGSVEVGSGWATAGASEWTGEGGSGPGVGGDEIQGGPWRGQTSTYNVCFNVSSDGSRLTPSGSPCGDGGGEAFDVNISRGGLSGDGCEDEDVDVDWDENIPIINNRFSQRISFGYFADYLLEGTFSNGDLNGIISASIFGNRCTATFTARPE